MKKNLIAFTIVLFFFSCSEEMPEEIFYGSINGVVLNEYGQPLEDATLTLEGKETKTGINGTFHFEKIKTGAYDISAFKDFYLTEVRSVEIMKDSTAEITFELKAGESYLEVSDSIFIAKPNDVSAYVSVKSNSAWIIKNTSSWIRVSADKGEGNSNILLSWDINSKSDETRTDSVLITTGNQSKYIKIKQSFPVRIKEIKGITGNVVTGISDSVLVVFNKPVKLNSIKSNFNYCLTDTEYTMLDNGKSVRFTYNCAQLGGEYPFTINARSDEDEVFKENIVVPFYDSYIEIEGIIKDFKLSEDEQYIWVTTNIPDRLYCIDIKENSVKSTFELEFEPGKFAYNTYNDYLYVLPSFEKYIGIYSSCFYIIDPHSGKVAEKIMIEPDEFDHPQTPYIHPHDILFSPDGLGAIVLKNPGATGDKWRLIESYNGNKMSYHEDFINLPPDEMAYNFDFLFHNYKQEIIGAQDTDHTFSFINKDEVKQYDIHPLFRSNEFYAGGNNTVKRFHKHENKYYVAAAPGSQCIINLDTDVYSNVLFAESRGATADFSYMPGDNNIIFHEAFDFFYVLDFSKAEVVMAFDKANGLKNITSLTDGETLIMTHVDYIKITSRFYRFSTDDLFKLI